MSKAKAIEPEKKGRGRPSKFDGIDQEQVRKLAERGWTDAQMSDFFVVTEQTWNNWKKAHPEFFESLKDWKEEADQKVEIGLYLRATGYEHPEDKIFNDEGAPLIVPTIKHYPPDTTACIFWLKNRKPKEWRDQPDQAGQSDSMEKLFAAAAKVMEANA